MKNEVDAILAEFGKYGRWQFFIFCSTAWLYIILAWHVFAITFQGASPVDFHCAVPQGVNVTSAIPNSDNSCEQYVNFSSLNENTTTCTQGYWYNESNGKTIVSEWDLVCDRSIYVELSSTLFFAGKLVGAISITTMADMFGRKTMMIAGYALFLLVSFIQTFSQGYIMYACMRFFIAVFETGASLAGYCLLCEFIPMQSRAWALTIDEVFWSLGVMLLPLLALMFKDWRTLQAAMTVPLLVTLGYYWIIPESPHWLVTKNRVAEAEKVLKKAGRMNRTSIPEKCFSNCSLSINGNTKQHTARQQTLLDIYRTPSLRVFATLLLLVWVADAMVYYGLTLGVGELTGNLHLNFFLSGLVEIPALIAAKLCSERFGRVKSLSAFHLIGGVTLASLLFLPGTKRNGEDISWITTTVISMGKAANSAGFAALFLYTVEIYPTEVRNSGLGMSSSVARIGSMIAPLTIALQRHFAWLQPVLFGSLAFIAGFVVIFFPETRGKVLPETLEEWPYWKEHGHLSTRQKQNDMEKKSQLVTNNTKSVSSASTEIWL